MIDEIRERIIKQIAEIKQITYFDNTLKSPELSMALTDTIKHSLIKGMLVALEIIEEVENNDSKTL